MQQDAKLWGARYDALRPPKPVDFLQCFLLEMVERPGSPFFACECVSATALCADMRTLAASARCDTLRTAQTCHQRRLH